MNKIFRPIKHMFRSPSCQGCARSLDNVHFDIDGGKLICPFCETKNDPTELYNDSEIIGVSEILIPNDYERFLTNVGFKKKPVRRTPKIGLIFLILLMSLGAVIGVLASDFNIYLKLLLALLAIWLVASGIMRHYKDEEKPKWHREKITI